MSEDNLKSVDTSGIRSTGYRRGSSTSGTAIGDSEDQMYEWREQYLGRWHPMGYGTRVSQPVKRDDGKWTVHVHRWNSCS